MARQTFIAACLSGSEDPGNIDDWVERWHESRSDLELHDYLGMTAEEYANWVMAPAALGHIPAIRKMVDEARVQMMHGHAKAAHRIN